MPLNFELDFTQPLVNDMTMGNLSDGEDFAKAIVKYYIAAVKKGMPVGVPPSLPAPGLNPLAPPPFTIGASAIKVNPTNKKVMTQTIKAYMVSKELLLNKGAVLGLKQSLEGVTNHLKMKKKEIQDTIQKTKLLVKEIANLPITIQDLVDGCKEIIQEEKESLKKLTNLFTTLESEFTKDEIAGMFAEELSLIDTVSNFKLTSFEDLQQIPQKFIQINTAISRIAKSTGTVGLTTKVENSADLARVRELTRTQDNMPLLGTSFISSAMSLNLDAQLADATRITIAKEDRVAAAKHYIASKLAQAVTSIEALAKIVLSPPSFKTYMNRLIQKKPQHTKLLRAIEKFEFIKNIAEPELKKLEKKIQELKREIQITIQPKIDKIKQKIEDKIAEATKKLNQSQAVVLFKKVKKKVKEIEKNQVARAKKVKKKIQKIQKALLMGTDLAQRSVLLAKSLEAEVANIEIELKLLVADVTTNFSKIKDLGKGDLEAKLNEANRVQASAVSTIANTSAITAAPQNINSVQSGAQAAQNIGNTVQNLSSTAASTQTSLSSLKNISNTSGDPEVTAYLVDVGMTDYAKVIAAMVAKTGADLFTLKKVLETKRSKFGAYKETIVDLVKKAKELMKLVQEIANETHFPGAAKIIQTASGIGNKIATSSVGRFVVGQAYSLRLLLDDIQKKVKPYIDKAIAWINKQLQTLKKYILKKAEEVKKEVELYLLNLLPPTFMKKMKEEILIKKNYIEAKKKKIEHYQRIIKRYARKFKFVARAGKGFLQLSNNVIAGQNLRYPPNEKPITDLLEGMYGLQLDELDPRGGQAKSILDEKKEAYRKLGQLKAIDKLAAGLFLFLKEVSNSTLKELMQKDIDDFLESVKSTNAPYLAAMEVVAGIMKSPPASESLLLKLLSDLIIDNTFEDNFNIAFQEPTVVNFFVEFERKYLKKVIETLKTLADAKADDKSDFSILMNRWANSLDKKVPIIKFLLQTVMKIFKKIKSFIEVKIEKFLAKVEKKLKEELEKIKEKHEAELELIRKRLVNVDAIMMSVAFGLAARLFWTGANWKGPTGSTHITFTIGPFVKMKALPEDGVVGFVREMAKSFELQLTTMVGLVQAPPNTLIPPIPFVGYK